MLQYQVGLAYFGNTQQSMTTESKRRAVSTRVAPVSSAPWVLVTDNEVQYDFSTSVDSDSFCLPKARYNDIMITWYATSRNIKLNSRLNMIVGLQACQWWIHGLMIVKLIDVDTTNAKTKVLFPSKFSEGSTLVTQ